LFKIELNSQALFGRSLVYTALSRRRVEVRKCWRPLHL